MAVVVQKMVGNKYEDRFYPDFSGVAKSYNFYPVHPQKSLDGIASVALGLGKTVVEGGNTVRFCPKYPKNLIQFFSVKETMNNSQKDFYGLSLIETKEAWFDTYDKLLIKYDLSIAEQDHTLDYIGSTYSHENYVIYDGLSRVGPRIVTFGPLLRNNLFPLAEILDLLLNLGTLGMGTPVELEFAVNLNIEQKKQREFGLLQIRPLVINLEAEEINLDLINNEDLICHSKKVLGNGIVTDIHDIIVVDYNKFERSKSRDVAKEVSIFNNKLLSENKSYLLVGVGRWGTLDPWLGIPVTWDQISGAKAIIETGFKDMSVEPSQGSHFFQNITSFMVAYFTINEADHGFIDWDWLLNQKPEEEMIFTRHISFKKSVVIKMNGHKNEGVILKPVIET